MRERMVKSSGVTPGDSGGHLAMGVTLDLARGVTSRTGAPGVQAHLDACSRCRLRLHVWKGLAEWTVFDGSIAPAPGIVARAIAIMPERPTVSALTRLIAALHYDSIQEPLPAGVRDNAGEEQLVYKADNVIVDLRLIHDHRGELVMIGQVADVDRPSRLLGKVAVTLFEGRR